MSMMCFVVKRLNQVDTLASWYRKSSGIVVQ